MVREVWCAGPGCAEQRGLAAGGAPAAGVEGARLRLVGLAGALHALDGGLALGDRAVQEVDGDPHGVAGHDHADPRLVVVGAHDVGAVTGGVHERVVQAAGHHGRAAARPGHVAHVLTHAVPLPRVLLGVAGVVIHPLLGVHLVRPAAGHLDELGVHDQGRQALLGARVVDQLQEADLGVAVHLGRQGGRGGQAHQDQEEQGEQSSGADHRRTSECESHALCATSLCVSRFYRPSLRPFLTSPCRTSP